jgi:Leucine-rich repeat (LRR) protein
MEIILGSRELADILCDKVSDEIAKLTLLERLIFSSNQLVSVPYLMGDLLHLTHLDLSGNNITLIPNSIKKLKNIETLDARNNPLVEYGEGDTLGSRELKHIFDDKMFISQSSSEEKVLDSPNPDNQQELSV